MKQYLFLLFDINYGSRSTSETYLSTISIPSTTSPIGENPFFDKADSTENVAKRVEQLLDVRLCLCNYISGFTMW